MKSFCNYFNTAQCRSCKWIEIDYAQQLLNKEKLIQDALTFFPPFHLEKTIKSPTQGFRNKVKMSVTGTVADPVIGLTGETSLDNGRALLSCPIHHPRLNELLAAMPELIRQFDLTPYQIGARKGELKGLIAFHSPGADQTYLRFILRSQECISRIKKLIPVLQQRFPSLVCISANIQPIPHAILEGPDEIILTSIGFIEHQLGSLRLRASPQAFVQTNVQVATQLYETAAHWIAEVRPRKVLELFCGSGAFSFFAAQSCGECLGIEINEEAVKTANETATELGLNHLKFMGLRTGIDLKTEDFGSDLILANPPRRGLGDALDIIRRVLPAHFIYSSCSIATLPKDLGFLSKNYRLKRVQLFDMFPHTEHFETLVWLERLEP